MHSFLPWPASQCKLRQLFAVRWKGQWRHHQGTNVHNHVRCQPKRNEMSNEPARQLSRVAVIVVVVVVQECHPNQSERRPFDCLSALPQINGDHHLMAIARLVLGLPPAWQILQFLCCATILVCGRWTPSFRFRFRLPATLDETKMGSVT